MQSEYSLWSRLPQLGLLQACKRLGTALVAFSPLARGTLSDVRIDPAQLPEKDFRRPMPRFAEPNYSRNMVRIDRFRAFAKSRGWHPSGLAIAWLLHQGDHVIPIPGTRTAEHIAECATGADIKLSAADLQAIDEILPPGWAHGNRYSASQQADVELYC